MPLQYAGPKPLISAHGITFDLNKEDKFAYLSIVAELIQALDHNYQADERYTYLAKAEPLNADIIFNLIKSKDATLVDQIDERRKIVENEITDELKRAHENKILGEEERNVLIRNIELMRDYQMSRSVNKAVYYAGINVIANEIKQGHIDYIKAPMFQKFMHVFHSIQGALNKLHPPMNSNIDIYEEEKHLHIRLEIKAI